DDHLAPQIREHYLSVALVKMTGQLGCVEDEVEVFAVQCKTLQAVVGAGSDYKDGGFAPGIDPNAMRAVQLAGAATMSSKGADEFGVLGVLIDVAGAVTVGNVNIAVRRDGNVRGLVEHASVIAAGVVSWRFDGITKGEDFFSP